MTRRGICVWLLCGLSATVVFTRAASARPGVVKTTDGQTYDGEVDDKGGETVTVTVHGIVTRVERTRVASIAYPDDFQREFNDRMAAFGPRDMAGRLKLARDAFDQKQYVLARQAAESAREIDPNNPDAAALLDTITSQMRLERAKTSAETSRPGATSTAPTTQPPADQQVLRPADINAIRQAELRPDDPAIRVRFERDVKKRYITYANIQPSEFNSMTPNQQVQRIIKDGTPEMKRDVLILTDPPSLLQYRRAVQPFITLNCATSGCHGGSGAEKFSLVVPAESDAATYTNFYILQHYAKPLKNAGDNVFGRGSLKMIDRQHSEQSMLLQYALPGAVAEFDHPDVPNYHPPFRGVTDTRYRQMSDWIGKSLQPIDPEYGIDFAVPGMAASTQPAATQPAQLPETRPAEPATHRTSRPPTRPVAPARVTPPRPR
jgi:hypothetical protein